MKISNIPLIGKVLIVLFTLGAMTVGTTIFSTTKMRMIDDAYSAAIVGEAYAATSLARSNRAFAQMNAAVANVVVSDTAERNRAAMQAIEKAKASFVEWNGKAAAADPARAAEIDGLKQRALTVVDQMCAAAIGLGSAAVTVEAVMASQKEYLANCADNFLPIGTAITALVDSELVKVTAVSDDLTAMTNFTIATTYGVVLGGLATVMLLGFFAIRFWASVPLKALAERMDRLASGDITVPIDGTDRRDEVGLMARAVQVFKDAAHENKRMAADVAAAEAAKVVDRDRQTAIDSAKAEDLKIFAHAVDRGLEALAAGDLTVRMTERVAPEFEVIREKFNGSIGKLEEALSAVVGSIGAIRIGLNQITVASNDLSQRTEQQAASLEETVAALSEVTRGVNATAESAGKAQGAAGTAQKNAEKGGEIVSKAVAAMSAIEHSSEQIGKIIGVIDEIAFQTNLLALNAGVEAARAGEAGRGFAVVAQEVRGLAQRSAEAAKEIKDLISTSSAQVEQGVALVTASGRSLGEIVDQVAEMSTVVAEIAKSAREQAVSLREVSSAADQMDKVTQQNAAMVEETTAAAQTLSGETEDLAALVERFTLSAANGSGRSGQPNARGRAPAARRPAAQGPVPQMKATGRGGAAPAASADEWAEF